MNADLLKQCDRAQSAGHYRSRPRSEFMNYIIQLGLNKYEKVILPVEMEDEIPARPGKIIPFPGGQA